MYILAVAKRYPIAFTLYSMICSQLMEYLLNMEFCKIPNFGTVTMKTSNY